KAITVVAARGVHAAITATAANTNAITVNAGADDRVVLRNLYLNGEGIGLNGIDWNSARALLVDDLVITDFQTGLGRVQLDDVEVRMLMRDSLLRSNQTALFLTADQGTIESRIEHSTAELGTVGFMSSQGTQTTIVDSSASGNVGSGFLQASTGELVLIRCSATGNGTGVEAFGPQGAVVVSDSVISFNDLALKPAPGATLLTRSNNTVTRNGAPGAFTGTVPAI
ncbi:MAG TPA: right-handed parallel beta-helix repeat-containing protein, partial [Solirubrobacteraceae bacterium]|nr:right-handed parallel beta-helix repeat-containing protein [Solirubrobacteraceae bacterium]